MIQHARRPIETDKHRHDQERRSDYTNRIFVGQSDGNYGTGKLPGSGVESIAEPVGDQGVDGPFAVGAADGIEVCGWNQSDFTV